MEKDNSPIASSNENRTTFPSFWKSIARFAIHLNPVNVSYEVGIVDTQNR